MLGALFCGGAPLPIGDRIGRGGEGEVYAVADGSARVVKIYFEPDAAREAKVRAIVAARLSPCHDVAFPLDIVRYVDGRFAGFTMRAVAGHQPIHELIATSSRRQHFPNADWRFLVHAARNVARVVASVHAAGVVIGDINSAGFLVSQQATVALIDADSFQIGAHCCRVGMPEYTPAELQGVHFAGIDRTKNHDLFGLAILLFQILMLGRHPYAGVTRGRPVPLGQAITQGRFAYSMLRTVSAGPPPGALRLDELPRAIGFLFERAFAPAPGQRPTAADWICNLGMLASTLTPCPRISNHHNPVATTPCPWCRIERSTGKPIYPGGSTVPTISKNAPPTQLCQDAERAIRRAKQHAGEAISPMWSRPAAVPSKAARKALPSQGEISGKISATLRALMLAPEVRQKFFINHDAANLAAMRALEDWRTQLGIWDIAKRTDELRTTVDRIETVLNHRSSMVAQATARAAAKAIAATMANIKLDAMQVAGIGTALKKHLARSGITTAADITRPALSAIGGIGETRIVALLFWREAIATNAEQAARSTPHGAGRLTAEAAVDSHIRQLEQRTRDLIADLEPRVARVRKSIWLIDRVVEDALLERDQSVADLAYFGLAGVPRQKTNPANVVQSDPKKPKAKARKKQAAKGCPRCGSPMVKRWRQPSNGGAALFLGCSTYPKCNGTQSVRAKRASP